ncbi:uncharacterized protein L969DRAFT_97481 [Mixia osmundae IAM 14324]|uniref:Transcription initiation factor TFIID subunit 4 n=1 Tax=Mixia osmundae (strain CBS 9802 / IAM 14324 / JCM 22182 / KY 12970) TaxID=764103 RepID=G7E4E4_MIXOS|nr:uncharacterized protein L969DRAFT_97481 [Mixia osmundae IAM 14324]KEI36280.1 hypothetical protein L969DRAFT_97481 [Mixia osmundae IAM 14324]GAA97704.1 hypothetical protein E5Q_04382 [Mixia osmundae IAM 14324]
MSGPGPGYSLPGRPIKPAIASPAPGTPSAQPAVVAGQQPPVAPPEANAQADLDTLNDASAVAGVDLNAEEDRMRAVNQARAAARPTGQASYIGWDRSRRQTWVEMPALTEAVKRIAQKFDLRNLEPDTLPLIALAAQHRLRDLVTEMIVIRRHRVHSSHLRPPPLDPSRDDGPSPLWDEVIYSDHDKIFRTLDRLELEEERRARRERIDRDQRELEQLGKLDDLQRPSEPGSPAASGPTPTLGNSPLSTPGPGDGKKRKRDNNPTATSKALPEAVQKLQTNRTAMRSLGGSSKKFSWLSGGSSPAMGSPTPASALGSKLPKPKFPPAAGLSDLGGPPKLALANTLHKTTSRLADVPLGSEATGSDGRESLQVILMKDALFALEKERGTGAGKGTGSQSVYRHLAKVRKVA